MKLTIDTEVLQREKLSIGDFLVMLIGYYDQSYRECLDKLIRDGTVQPNLFKTDEMVLSDNTKNLIARILTESDSKAQSCGIDFLSLAVKLQSIYPKGNKPGTTYSWRDKTEVIAQKLRLLVVKYNFMFTEDEAIKATKDYVDSFKDYDKMQLLKYFTLKTDGQNEMNSMFMTIIENNR